MFVYATGSFLRAIKCLCAIICLAGAVLRILFLIFCPLKFREDLSGNTLSYYNNSVF